MNDATHIKELDRSSTVTGLASRWQISLELDTPTLTVNDVATAAGVSERLVWKRIAAGVLKPDRKDGRIVRFRTRTVQAWLDGHGCA